MGLNTNDYRPRDTDEMARHIARHAARVEPVLLSRTGHSLDNEAITSTECRERLAEAAGVFEDQLLVRRGLAASGQGKHIMFAATDTGAGIAASDVIYEAMLDPRVSTLSFFGGAFALNRLGMLDGFERHNPSGIPLFKKLDDVMTGLSPHGPVDITICTTNTWPGPERVLSDAAAGIYAGTVKRNYLICEGWGIKGLARQFGDGAQFHGIFCNDPLAQLLLRHEFPKFPVERVYPTGTAQTDPIEHDEQERLRTEALSKLGLSGRETVILYLGDFSGSESYDKHHPDIQHEINARTWQLSLTAVIEAARRKPSRDFALVYRAHPGSDPREDPLHQEVVVEDCPVNLRVISGSHRILAMDEAAAAADITVSIISTENNKAAARGKAGVFLAYTNEPGLGGDLLPKYFGHVWEAFSQTQNLTVVYSPQALTDRITSTLPTRAIGQPNVSMERSAKRILDVVLRE